MRNWKKRFFLLPLLALLFSILSSPATAVSKNDLPYDSYGSWKGQGASQFVVQKAVYTPTQRVTGGSLGAGGLVSPSNLAATDDRLYLLDSGNSRVFVLDENFKLLQTIGTFSWKGEKISYEKAEGIYVDAEGKIFIADTVGERVLICNEKGNLERILTAPKSDVIPSDLSFAPIEVAQDEDGYLFVLCKGVYYGALVFNREGEFQSFFGASKVEGSVLTIFSRLLDNLFGTDARREASLRKLPFEFSDLCYKEGFIYTASTNTKNNAGQLKKLSFSGENILVAGDESAENYSFGDGKAVMLPDGSYVNNRFGAIEVDDAGFIYGLDQTYGKIFLYDSECNLISAFGGGLSSGSQVGTFQNACDIALMGDRLIVLDKENGSFTVFEMTDYGKLLHQAVICNQTGDYMAARPLWEQVLTMDSYNQLAYRGIANACLLEENYDQALIYAKKGYDRKLYERAFEEVRRSWLADHFYWILPVFVLLLGGLIAFIFYTNKHKDKKLIKHEKLRTFIRMLLHPFESFYDIKYSAKGSVLIAGSVMLCYFIFSVLSITAGGFMYVSYDPMKYNSGLTFLGTTGVALLFCIVNIGVCTLFEGKGRLKEIFIVTGYALMPQIIYSILFIGGSYLLVYSESAIFPVLQIISWIATAVLLLIGLMVIHDYGFFKTIRMVLLTLLGMALVAFVVVLILTLFQDLFQFIDGAFKEILYRTAG